MNATSKDFPYFKGEGEVRALLRAHDWSASPLGHPHSWPQELLTVVELMLHAKYPAVVAWSADAIFLYNDAYAYMLGARHPDALGRRFQDVWPEIWHEIQPIVDKALAGIPSYFQDEPVIITPDGVPEQRWFTSSYSPVRDRQGKVAGMFNAGFETTSRVLNERRLTFQLELADRLRAMSSPEDIIAIASEMLGRQMEASRVVYAQIDDRNGTFSVQRGWSAEGVPGMTGEARPMENFGPDIVAFLRAGQSMIVNDVRQDPRTMAYADSYTRIGVCAFLTVPLVKAGRLAIVLSVHRTQPYVWQQFDSTLVLDVAERTWDAVERAISEQELKDREERLRQADRRKDEFLAMLAHELRNPLAPIGAAAELLQMAKLDEAGVRRTSQIIDRQVEHMTHLINDLLDVSRVTTGLVELDKSPLDIRQVVAEAVEQATPLIQSRRHQLTLHMQPESTIVLGDRKRLVQVVTNILTNAAKYTPEGGNILVGIDVREFHVLINVVDNGVGMTSNLAAHAFDLFSQAERTSDRSSGGLGLGLSLVKSLVELHHGTVNCESGGLGKGSKFTVCLPRHILENGRDDPPATHHSTNQSKKFLRILIVDDNRDAASMLAMLLEATGHQVMIENSSQRGLERAKAEAPDVCLLDIGLPDIDGNEMAHRLRAQPETAGSVLIAITGYGQENDRKQTLASGFDHHLVKPVNTKLLASILAGVGRA